MFTILYSTLIFLRMRRDMRKESCGCDREKCEPGPFSMHLFGEPFNSMPTDNGQLLVFSLP